jgi:hypothetical protein
MQAFVQRSTLPLLPALAMKASPFSRSQRRTVSLYASPMVQNTGGTKSPYLVVMANNQARGQAARCTEPDSVTFSLCSRYGNLASTIDVYHRLQRARRVQERCYMQPRKQHPLQVHGETFVRRQQRVPHVLCRLNCLASVVSARAGGCERVAEVANGDVTSHVSSHPARRPVSRRTGRGEAD